MPNRVQGTLLLVWQTSLEHPNGIAVQLKRMLAYPNRPPLFHIQAFDERQPRSHFPHYMACTVRLKPEVNLRVGGATIQHLWRSNGIRLTSRFAWWRGRLKGLAKPRVGYICVSNETEAQYAREIVSALNVTSYVVHLMDLLHHHGKEELNGGSMQALVQQATLVRVVSERLARAIRDWRSGPIEIAQLLPAFPPGAGDTPIPGTSRLFMSGSLNHGQPSNLDFLRGVFSPAWRHFAATHAGSTWVYAGSNHGFLHSDIAPMVQNLGQLSDEPLRQALARSSCALLPMQHSKGLGWEYSLPSRIIDYLAAGLPVLAPPSEGTATGDFVAEHNGNGVIVVRTMEDCYATLERLHSDPAWYRHHRHRALAIAKQFDPEEGRRSFQAALDFLQPREAS